MPLPLVLSSLLLMKACLFGEKPLILTLLAQAVTDTQHIRWTDLGLDPVLLSIRGHAILRWYSLANIGGILIGWWYLLKLLERSEERRVGKEWFITCRSGWSQYP